MATQDDLDLADELARYYADPLGYVLFAFPWSDPGSGIQIVDFPDKYREQYNWDCQYGPDEWAADMLIDLGEKIKARNFDGRHAVDPIQYAISSGHGIGKSAMVGWLSKFILDTRPHAKGVVTANTGEQLRTKTWAQVGYWHKMSLTSHWFDYSTGRGSMTLKHREHPESWRLDAQTSREENSESFAGLHAANSTPFYIFDEASAIADKIFEVRQGGTTDGEPMVFDFGNPTRKSGQFFEECQGSQRHNFNVRQIDSRNVQITNKRRIQQWVDDYGEDSDFVKVRVRGVFPSAGDTQFIDSLMVETAMVRTVVDDRYAPLVIGVDVARFGDDDSVIFTRLGTDCRSFPVQRFKKLDTVQLTGKVIETIRNLRAKGMHIAAIFVDDGGIGGGVVDQLRHAGYSVFAVNFGSRPVDSKTYRYKSDELWGNMKDMLPRLALPEHNTDDGRDLLNQLTQREFGYTLQGNKIHLETKKDMKKRGVASPDIADALALTFAVDIAALTTPHGVGEVGVGGQPFALSDYDPLNPED